jgi:hypothetical protein
LLKTAQVGDTWPSAFVRALPNDHRHRVVNIKLELIRGFAFHRPDYNFLEARFRFMNMGEDVYRKLHDICLVGLAEIDRV